MLTEVLKAKTTALELKATIPCETSDLFNNISDCVGGYWTV